MTREEKAKAYDEALKRAKEIKSKILSSHLSTESCKAVSEYIDEIIPELRESEDERIRKVIYKLMLGMREEIFTSQDEIVTKEKVLAYLEKQKEHQNNSDAPNESSWSGMISSSDKDKNLDDIAQDYLEAVKEYNPEPTWNLMQTAVCYGYHYREQEEQKPFTPKYRVGDVMRTKQEAAEGITDGLPVIVSMDDDYYYCTNEKISISEQEEYEFPPMNMRQKPIHTAKEMWKEIRLEVYAQASGNRHEPNCSDNSTKMFSLCDIDEIFEKIGNSTVVSQPAEWKDLTWKDIVELEGIINNVHYDFSAGIGQESFGKEVLERFRSSKGIEYLDESEQKYWQKKQKSRINIDQLKSLMLQYLQEAANEKDDSDIQADTEKWARKILEYDFEQKPEEWSDEDEMIYQHCKTILHDYGYDDWLKSFPERFNLQPKNEWSEEEKTIIDCAVEVVEKAGLPSLAASLKSLQLYPKQEWSEEEKDKLKSIERLIVNANAHGNYLIGDKEAIDLQHFIRSIVKPTTNLAEWSEFDEDCLKRAIWYVENPAPNVIKDTNLVLWLKSLYPQPREEIYHTAKHDLAIKFMNYLDENRPEGKMGLSNSECEEIDKAFKENDWEKIIRYIEKYKPHWKPSEQDIKMLEHIIGQYETGNKNSKVMGYLPRVEELSFLKKVLSKWKN